MPSKYTAQALRSAATTAELGLTLDTQVTSLAKMFSAYKRIYTRPEDKPTLKAAVASEMTFVDSRAFIKRIVEPVIKRHSKQGDEHKQRNIQVRQRIMDHVVRYGTTFFLRPDINYKRLAERIIDGQATAADNDRIYAMFNALRQRSSAPYAGTLDYEVLNTPSNNFEHLANVYGYGLAHCDSRTSRMQLTQLSSIVKCDCCGEKYKASYMSEVWLEPTRSGWACTSCTNEMGGALIQCSMTGRWWKPSDTPEMEVIMIGGSHVWRAAAEAAGHIRMHEGRWVSVRRLAAHQSTLGGYHGVRRQWDHNPITEIPIGAIGVELEIGFKGGDETRDRFLRKELATTGRFADFPMIIESDSSLAYVPGGCEIIGPPLAFDTGYTNEDSVWKRFLKLLNENGAQGWMHREKAGIHVNLDARDMDLAHRLKFVAFVNNAAALSKFISGRKNLYQCVGARDTKQLRANTMFQGGYIEMRRDLIGDGSDDYLRDALYRFTSRKYSPVYIRANRPDVMEVRIFGSNIKYEGFMATVEYCVAIKEFVGTKTLAEIFSSTLSAEFRAWLGTKTDKYKNLCLRLGVVARELGTAVPSDKKVAAQLEAA